MEGRKARRSSVRKNNSLLLDEPMRQPLESGAPDPPAAVTQPLHDVTEPHLVGAGDLLQAPPDRLGEQDLRGDRLAVGAEDAEAGGGGDDRGAGGQPPLNRVCLGVAHLVVLLDLAQFRPPLSR